MFNLLHPKDNFKTIANCIDQMTNHDFEEFHLLQANISHIGFHERFYSSLLLVLDTPFFNESVQQNVFQQKNTSFAFKFTPKTLSNSIPSAIRGSPQLPVTVAAFVFWV